MNYKTLLQDKSLDFYIKNENMTNFLKYHKRIDDVSMPYGSSCEIFQLKFSSEDQKLCLSIDSYYDELKQLEQYAGYELYLCCNNLSKDHLTKILLQVKKIQFRTTILQLYNCHLNDKNLHLIFEISQNVKYLNLSNCSFCNMQPLAQILSHEIRYVCLANNNINNEDLRYLQNIPCRFLKLYANQITDPDIALEMIKSNKNLCYVNLLDNQVDFSSSYELYDLGISFEIDREPWISGESQTKDARIFLERFCCQHDYLLENAEPILELAPCETELRIRMPFYELCGKCEDQLNIELAERYDEMMAENSDKHNF